MCRPTLCVGLLCVSVAHTTIGEAGLVVIKIAYFSIAIRIVTRSKLFNASVSTNISAEVKPINKCILQYTFA